MRYQIETIRSFLGRCFCLLITLLGIFLSASVCSQAASGQIIFLGHVVKPVGKEAPTYPRQLVSFSDKILLPLNDLHNQFANQVAVYSRNGRIVHQLVDPAINDSLGNLYAAVLLDGNIRHSFQICIGVEVASDCLRYEVIRAD